ncbi:MAG: amidohydrolase family protein [Anaerolineae bacterium]|nr:amidohydrolase family protein [Anaerolineae bacterium]
MNVWQSRMTGIVDGHVHMGSITSEDLILDIRGAIGVDRMALVSIQDPAKGSGLPQSLYMKARHPNTFYVFAGLNHGEKLSDGRVRTPSLVSQLDSFVAMGCDGIKMIEGKPTSRQVMNIPVTDPYFADYWTRVEELDVPIVWHVNDPEEFWNPEQLPAWARKQGWGYGPNDVKKEQLYAEVDEVLASHPKLRIVFAHFYFLSADLDRAARFFDAHPSVHFDLTPGVEMLFNMSRNPDATREFFHKYANRIVFGTDIASRNTVAESVFRAGIVYRWLESEDAFRVPEGADFLLGQPDDGIIRGLGLPDDVLARIYHDNFARLAGERPRSLDIGRAVAECTRIGAIAQGMSNTPAEDTEAILVARQLEALA